MIDGSQSCSNKPNAPGSLRVLSHMKKDETN